MPRSVPSPSRSDQQRYLRLLKRRQRASLWLEMVAGSAVVVALVCFIAEQLTTAALAWWLGVGCLLLALVCVVIEAIDERIEHSWRMKQMNQRQNQGYPNPQQAEEGTADEEAREGGIQMIRTGARWRHQHHLERERCEREQQAQIAPLRQRWIPFSLLIQVELQSHLTRFGLDAADHATLLMERMLLEQESRSTASLLSAPPSPQFAQRREPLAKAVGWDDFPETIAELLWRHFVVFAQESGLEQAEQDVERATNILRFVLDDLHANLGAALDEHRFAFGVQSMADVASIAATLRVLLETQHES